MNGPDLLSALENALDLLRFHCQVNPDMNGEYMDCLAQCDNVIQKVKGN